MEALLDQARDLGHVLQSGPAADEAADREVEAVVVEEGEGHGGRGVVARRGGGGDEGHGERAAEADDGDGERNGQDGG